jgi:putative transposase
VILRETYQVDSMEHAMTNPSIDPARSLHEHLTAASPDLLRSLLTVTVQLIPGSCALDLAG